MPDSRPGSPVEQPETNAASPPAEEGPQPPSDATSPPRNDDDITESERLYNNNDKSRKILFLLCLGLKETPSSDVDGGSVPTVELPDLFDYRKSPFDNLPKNTMKPSRPQYQDEVIRRGRLLDKRVRPANYNVPRCEEWLQENPIPNAADIRFLRREVESLKALAEDAEREREEAQRERQAALGERRAAFQTGESIPRQSTEESTPAASVPRQSTEEPRSPAAPAPRQSTEEPTCPDHSSGPIYQLDRQLSRGLESLVQSIQEHSEEKRQDRLEANLRHLETRIGQLRDSRRSYRVQFAAADPNEQSRVARVFREVLVELDQEIGRLESRLAEATTNRDNRVGHDRVARNETNLRNVRHRLS